MKRIVTICIIAVVWLCQPVTAINYFTIAAGEEQGQVNRMYVNTTYTESTNISLNRNTDPISGLSISGVITKQEDDYLVRVILKDKDGHEYCVLESYDMINDNVSFSFTDYCEETALLDGIDPDSLIIVVRKATLKLDNVKTLYIANRGVIQYESYTTAKSEIKKAQVNNIVSRINTYNLTHRKLWGAGVTPLALKSYEQKRKYLGLNNNESSGGFEYYCSGIFEAGTPSKEKSVESSICVSQFDWCNRHGRSWITGIRDQKESSFCFAFTAIAAIESMLMLYYNSNDSVILSADMAARCTYSNPYNTYHNGGLAYDVLQYIKDNGVCDNAASPFIDSDTIPCRSGVITPNEWVTISDYNKYYSNSEDFVKEKLIYDGPLTSGYLGHAMLLVGYGVIQIGDVIRINYGTGNTSSNYTVEPSDTNYIGKTYWKFKNSYGYNPNLTVDGYSYILFNNLYYMRWPCSVVHPYRTIDTSSNIINCKDYDGDGYYFWGFANKPSNCPSWVPDTPDGDDSNWAKGKMLLSPKGALETLNPDSNPTLTITGDVTYNTRQSCYSHIVISSGAKLTVKNILNMFGRVTIDISSGGQLVIDGGAVSNANITMASDSQLKIINDGKLTSVR